MTHRSSPLMMPSPHQRGHTLIELMIVVAIVAILAAVALPSYSNYIHRSQARTAAADLAALGLALEQSAGQIAPQGWEFYAVTGALFLTLAFPGFVYRYLYKRKH